MKTCTKCGAEKPLTEYSRDKSRPSGTFPWCKECEKNNSRTWYQKNKEEQQAKGRQRYQENRTEKLAYNKFRRGRDKGKIAEWLHTWYEANKERRKEYNHTYREANKERLSESGKVWVEQNRDIRNQIERRYYGRNRTRQYGLSNEAYQIILEAQGGVCAICQQPETATRRGKVMALSVDHDHELGYIRGLLCSRCNVAIGMFADNPDRMVHAIEYLERAVKERKIVQLRMFEGTGG